MPTFGCEVVGRTYKKGATVFMVMAIDLYPEDRIKAQFREQLMRLKPGQLVAVSFRGTLIPNITVQGGVVRLNSVAIDGEVISGPKAISAALGINSPYQPYSITTVV